jgi:hypothetical protein
MSKASREKKKKSTPQSDREQQLNETLRKEGMGPNTKR